MNETISSFGLTLTLLFLQYDIQKKDVIKYAFYVHVVSSLTDGRVIQSFKVSPGGDIIASNDTTFTCMVEGRPDSTIVLVGPDNKEIKKVDSDTQLQHTIQNVSCSNSGKYQCAANNSKTGKVNTAELSIDVLCKLVLVYILIMIMPRVALTSTIQLFVK